MKNVKSQVKNQNCDIVFVNGSKYAVDKISGEYFEVFEDLNISTGKLRPWSEKKLQNQSVKFCYRILGDKSRQEFYNVVNRVWVYCRDFFFDTCTYSVDVDYLYKVINKSDIDISYSACCQLLSIASSVHSVAVALTADCPLACFYALRHDLDFAYENFCHWFSRANRLYLCASSGVEHTHEDKVKTISDVEFCHVRLCPVCSWRRSLKINSNLISILDKTGDNYKYLALTLTVQNVFADKLPETIDKLMNSFHKFIKYKKISASLVGWFRSMEITQNRNFYVMEEDGRTKTGKKKYRFKVDENGKRIKNPWYLSYHPHFHVILCMDTRYCDPNYDFYIRHSEWLEMWRRATGDKNITQLNIQVIKDKPENDSEISFRSARLRGSRSGSSSKGISRSRSGAVAEVGKYITKFEDLVNPKDWKLSAGTIETMDKALHHRQLVAYGGLFKELHNKLHLDDDEDGDLLHVDQNETDTDIIRSRPFFWSVGYSQYLYDDNGELK